MLLTFFYDMFFYYFGTAGAGKCETGQLHGGQPDGGVYQLDYKVERGGDREQRLDRYIVAKGSTGLFMFDGKGNQSHNGRRNPRKPLLPGVTSLDL